MTPRQFEALREVMQREADAKNERADFHAGLVASVIANVNRDPKKRPDPFTAADFMPNKAPKPKKKPTTDPLALATAITRANKGEVLK